MNGVGPRFSDFAKVAWARRWTAIRVANMGKIPRCSEPRCGLVREASPPSG